LSKEVLALVGNTPIIELHNVVPDGGAEVWLKYETGNLTGSYKDRMAMPVLANAMSWSDVPFGDTIVKFTRGSTGSSLAFVSAALGLKFVAVFSDAFSQSKQQTMEAFGAEVIVEKSYDKGITPELIGRMKDRALDICDNSNAYYVDQFGSPDVTMGCEPMGQK
jgi:cysteine synthase A